MLYNEGFEHIPSGCAISGILDKRGRRFDGTQIITSIGLMHERSNGLGGGFAAYGIYPEFPDHYAFHVFYDDMAAKEKTERFLNEHFFCEHDEALPTRKVRGVGRSPIIWRYFLQTNERRRMALGFDEEEYVVRCVIRVNSDFDGAFIFSSGKNMGAFKGVGYPEDLGEFFMLERYKAYCWTAHGRFPTNTPGWWGGAHPFTLLDWSIVHNGEISSYDANRRYIEQMDYHCALMTDTEVLTYLTDQLLRRQKLPLDMLAKVLAAPMWERIDEMDETEKRLYTALRTVYAGALVNGPFSIIIGFNGGMMALNDRLKLRSMVAAHTKDRLYIASEESAIRVIAPEVERIWAPRGGEAVIGLVDAQAQIGTRRYEP